MTDSAATGIEMETGGSTATEPESRKRVWQESAGPDSSYLHKQPATDEPVGRRLVKVLKRPVAELQPVRSGKHQRKHPLQVSLRIHDL
jgi:hypothetical protein